MKLDYIAVDIETTGFSPWRGGRILEIGAVAVKNGQVVEEFQSLINPGAPIPAATSRIHGIYPEMIRDAPGPEAVLHAFSRFIGRSVLVAHNAPFERQFLHAEMAGIGMGLFNPFQCTLRLSRQKCPGLNNYRLETVSRYLLGDDMGNVRFHRALDDARVTAKVYMALCEKGSIKS